MCQSSEKVVPEWDTDLNLRLKQLDNVLATAKTVTSLNMIADEIEIDQARERKRYTCSQCSATFNSNAARNSHKRRIHERFHLCHDCDMAFASAQKLERHMKTHSGIKEFKCHTCGKEFMIERNLVRSQWPRPLKLPPERPFLLTYLSLSIISDFALQTAFGTERFCLHSVPSHLFYKIRTASAYETTSRSSFI